MDKKQQTINTYNTAAEAMASKFNAQGARIEDIEYVFSLLNKPNPRVLEIGCGNGRDAFEILKRTLNYTGMDISEKLVDLAQKKNPQAKFEVGDIESFKIPQNTDIIFSFASLIHSPREKLKEIFKKCYETLEPQGLFRLSLKYRPNYSEETKEDQFGVRTYYFYSDKDIEEMKGKFKIVMKEIKEIRGQIWLEFILQK